MKPVPLVRASILKPMMETLARRGAPVEALLAGAGLPVLPPDERLVPLQQGLRLFADAARQQRAPEIGLIAGGAASVLDLGVVGRLLRRSRTLGEGLAALFAVTASFTSGERWWLTVENDRALICHTFLDPSPYGHTQVDHYGVALAINLVRTVAGADWTPPEVHFETGPVPALAERTGLLRGTRILFSQPFSSVALPVELLGRRFPGPTTTPDDDDRIAEWHASAPAANFAGSVRQVMWSLTPEDGRPRMQTTALALGMSVRTLQRQLAESGQSFEQLLRADRLRMAMWCLERTNARVLDIALDLGYSDHAHFTRAFRRWTGLSPLQYRRASLRRAMRRAETPGCQPSARS